MHITYRAANAVRFFKDHDEFYWNVTGNDWKVPIEEASAFVALPSAAAGQLKAQAFTGGYGSREQGSHQQHRWQQHHLRSPSSLPPRSGLTIDVYIPKGILKEPSWFTRNVVWFIGGNPGALLPVWAFAVMFGLWWWKGRDPDPGVSVAPMYEPPKGLTPAEAGTLLADAIEARDITSTLIDLAVKGYLKIIEHEDKVLFITHKDYILRLMKPRSEWQNLAAHELEVLNNIFPGGYRRGDHALQPEEPLLHRPALDPPGDHGLRSRPKTSTPPIPNRPRDLALVGVLMIALPFALAADDRSDPALQLSCRCWRVGVLLTVLIVFLFGRQLAAKTVRGARTRVECLGFKEFMTRVDGDRIKRMPPDTFEKFLPYAMAFGVEQHWAKAFQGLLTEPPSWYVGSGYGTPGMMWTPLLFTSVHEFVLHLGLPVLLCRAAGQFQRLRLRRRRQLRRWRRLLRRRIRRRRRRRLLAVQPSATAPLRNLPHFSVSPSVPLR